MKIGYLYYDLLNLYGDNGNVKVLTYNLKQLNVPFELKLLTVGDDIDFNELDFVYMGFGTENNQKIVFNDLLKYKDDIKNYIESGKFFLATGNSIELFGKGFLELFDYETEYKKARFSSEVLVEFDKLEKPLIGLFNQIGITKGGNLFKMLRGPFDGMEGFNYKNFYATYIIGPILVRNPHFLEFMLKEITKKEIDLDLSLEYTAYNTFIENIDKDRKL